jgi:gluconate 2-dehydrogenase gamma chain
MNTSQESRRNFLFQGASGLGSTWIALHWPAILQAHEHARDAAADPNAKLEFFSPAERTEIEAMAAQIIPSDAGSPGAREAGVIYFIDRALTTFDRERQPVYKDGLPLLEAHSREMFADATAFSKLSSGQQIRLLTAIEKTDFFVTVRVHTIMGFFADPSYGGNRDQAGWKLIGFEQKAAWKPPFGYYDAEENR